MIMYLVYHRLYTTPEDERTLIFQKVQKGEMIFTLEKDRRSGYPIFDTAPGFEEFRQYMDQRISTQETLLQRIAQELGLDKPKQQ